VLVPGSPLFMAPWVFEIIIYRLRDVVVESERCWPPKDAQEAWFATQRRLAGSCPPGRSTPPLHHFSALDQHCQADLPGHSAFRKEHCHTALPLFSLSIDREDLQHLATTPHSTSPTGTRALRAERSTTQPCRFPDHPLFKLQDMVWAVLWEAHNGRNTFRVLWRLGNGTF
jgi:hypothetical protein